MYSIVIMAVHLFKTIATKFRFSKVNDVTIKVVFRHFQQGDPFSFSPKYRAWERCHASCAAHNDDRVIQTANDLLYFLLAWSPPKSNLPMVNEGARLVPLVRLLMEERYKTLFDCSARHLDSAETQRLVLALASNISIFLKDNNMCSTITDDTVTTTIMWAATGCIVPYDPLSRKGMRVAQVAPDSFSVSGLSALSRFFIAHEQEFESIRALLGNKMFSSLPDALLLGIYFHQLGEDYIGT